MKDAAWKDVYVVHEQRTWRKRLIGEVCLISILIHTRIEEKKNVPIWVWGNEHCI